jgi:Polysaccharide biosynthesis protein
MERRNAGGLSGPPPRRNGGARAHPFPAGFWTRRHALRLCRVRSRIYQLRIRAFNRPEAEPPRRASQHDFWVNVATGLVLALVLSACAPAIARFYDEPILLGMALVVAVTFLLDGLNVVQNALLQKLPKQPGLPSWLDGRHPLYMTEDGRLIDEDRGGLARREKTPASVARSGRALVVSGQIASARSVAQRIACQRLVSIVSKPTILAVPAQKFWEPRSLKKLPGIVLADDRPGAPEANLFWASNLEEAGQVLHGYQSAWLPASLLEKDKQENLGDALLRGCPALGRVLARQQGPCRRSCRSNRRGQGHSDESTAPS